MRRAQRALGVESLNARATQALTQARLIDGSQPWYEGRPVLMTRNDYGLGLMNGDIGIALMLPEGGERERMVCAWPSRAMTGRAAFASCCPVG